MSHEEAKEKKGKRAFDELVEKLSEEEFKKVLESSDGFRRGFELG